VVTGGALAESTSETSSMDVIDPSNSAISDAISGDHLASAVIVTTSVDDPEATAPGVITPAAVPGSLAPSDDPSGSPDPASRLSSTLPAKAPPSDAVGVLSQALSSAKSTNGIGDYVASIFGSLGFGTPTATSASSAASGNRDAGGSGLAQTSDPGGEQASILSSGIPTAFTEQHTTQESAYIPDAVVTRSDGQSITVVQQESAIVVHDDSSVVTLAAGSQMTADGLTYSLRPTGNGVVVNGQDLTLSAYQAGVTASEPSAAVISGSNGQQLTVVQAGSKAIIAAAGSTVTLNPDAQTTFEGRTFEQASSGILVDGSSAVLSRLTVDAVSVNAASQTVISVGDSLFTASKQSDGGYQVTVDTTTFELYPGDSPVTLSSVTISEASDGSVQTVGALSSSTSTSVVTAQASSSTTGQASSATALSSASWTPHRAALAMLVAVVLSVGSILI